jgi:CRISPR-associated endonuclease Csn1
MLQRFASANARNYAYKIMPPPFPVDRQDLKERLLAMLISYKPDHGLEGPLFDESAYGYNLNEKPPQEFFIRKPLASLTWKIIQDEDVLSKSIRKKISEFLQEQGLSKANSDDKALQRAMLVFMDQNHLHPRSVKIRAKNAEGYMLLEPGKNGRTGHKAYPKKDVLCVDIWQIPVGNKKYKFVGDFKKRADVHSMGGIIEKNRPHPAAKFLMRLYKNDIIRIQNGQIYTYALVAGLPASNKKLDLRPIYASSDIKSWLQYTRKEFCGSFWRPIETTQNFESINKLFGTQGNNISHVNITIDGKLSCRKI